MSVQRDGEQWLLFEDSCSGFKSRVNDIVIPQELIESELEKFLDDIYHEQAGAENPNVFRIS